MARPQPRDRKSKPGKPGKAGALRKGRKKYCQFCADKSDYIDYKDIALLRKFMSERSKIRARRVTGNCSQHQRMVATAIKNAREMALLAYTAPATGSERGRRER